MRRGMMTNMKIGPNFTNIEAPQDYEEEEEEVGREEEEKFTALK